MAPPDKTCIVIEIPYSNNDKIHFQSEDNLFDEVSNGLIKSGLIEKNK